MLVATRDFKGSIDGRTVSLKAGEAFSGTLKAADILKEHGLLTDKPKQQPKEAKNND